MRCIRSQMESLIVGLPDRELSAMSLGLAHRLVYLKSLNEIKYSSDVVNSSKLFWGKEIMNLTRHDENKCLDRWVTMRISFWVPDLVSFIRGTLSDTRFHMFFLTGLAYFFFPAFPGTSWSSAQTKLTPWLYRQSVSIQAWLEVCSNWVGITVTLLENIFSNDPCCDVHWEVLSESLLLLCFSVAWWSG